MAQFDVFENPIPRARTAFPFVIVLQSDLADTGRERIVAPLVSRGALPAAAGRLMPVVRVGDREYVLAVPSLTALAAADLKRPVTNLEMHRDTITAALDFLFQGI
ncbi:MAG TPA: CcdB family protein [Azospirillaceae bacterium]|nr:CcdB family protein [Azospirillaceae bacterium]